jgi:hypothetical protein
MANPGIGINYFFQDEALLSRVWLQYVMRIWHLAANNYGGVCLCLRN